MAKVKDGSRSQFSGKADGMVYVQINGKVYTVSFQSKKKGSMDQGM